VDCKLTPDTFRLIQIQIWFHFEYLPTHYDADWFYSLFNFGAWHHNLTEIIVNYTVHFWKVLLPPAF